MYEEDRQKALAMYNRLFDECTNEQGLIQMLASPTRQAVLVARAYDAKERKLQVSSQSREGNADNGGVPPFVTVIDNLFKTAEEKGLFGTAPEAAEEKQTSPEDENQMSFFDIAEIEEQTDGQKETETAEDHPAAAEVTAHSEEPSDEPADTAEMTDDGKLPAAEDDAPASADEAEPSEEEAPAEEPSAEAAQEEQEETPQQASPEEDAVDSFISSFSIENDDDEKTAPAEEAPVYALAPEPTEAPASKRKVKKPMAGWLILFVIFAIPIGVAGIILLCVPTLLSLIISGGLAGVGVLAVNAVLSSGFVVLADILLILGAALIIFGLGLLFLWLFIWLIGGAMVGLVQGLINLGGKWCYKEVAVNE